MTKEPAEKLHRISKNMEQILHYNRQQLRGILNFKSFKIRHLPSLEEKTAIIPPVHRLLQPDPVPNQRAASSIPEKPPPIGPQPGGEIAAPGQSSSAKTLR
jgi:hypothetical protein